MTSYTAHQCHRQSRRAAEFSFIKPIHQLQFWHSRMKARSIIRPKLRRLNSQVRSRNEASPEDVTCILTDVFRAAGQRTYTSTSTLTLKDCWRKLCEFVKKLLGITKRPTCRLLLFLIGIYTKATWIHVPAGAHKSASPVLIRLYTRHLPEKKDKVLVSSATPATTPLVVEST